MNRSDRFLTPRELANRFPKNGTDWYRVLNKADEDRAEIWIYDEIGSWGKTADEFQRELKELTVGRIDLHLASPGGDILDGIAIYNALRTHSAYVSVRVDSMAASIASVIAQAGDERIMVSGSQMMVHKAWMIVIGDDEEMDKAGEFLRKQNDIIAGIYAERAGGTGKKAHFLKLMAAETWMDAEETVGEGLADRVEKPKPKEAPEDASTVSTDDNDDDNEEEAAAKWVDDFLASARIS